MSVRRRVRNAFLLGYAASFLTAGLWLIGFSVVGPMVDYFIRNPEATLVLIVSSMYTTAVSVIIIFLTRARKMRTLKKTPQDRWGMGRGLHVDERDR